MRTLGRLAVFPLWIVFAALMCAAPALPAPLAQTPPRIPGVPGLGG